MSRRTLASLLVVLMLPACGGSTSAATSTAVIPDEEIHVFSAAVTPQGDHADLSLALHNATESTDRLTGVSCACASNATIYGGKGSEPATSVKLPPQEVVTFAPGSAHITLDGLTGTLTPGDTVTLDLTFEHAAPIEAVTTISKPEKS
jgi:copper(I)-binding protein